MAIQLNYFIRGYFGGRPWPAAPPARIDVRTTDAARVLGYAGCPKVFVSRQTARAAPSERESDVVEETKRTASKGDNFSIN